ncbi:hypothetical protein HMPREF1207_01643 [Paenibacillus sp. HGH0039]|nr:hypothetical protein HMPREF1207_01643 [Paenibacillus sp. HGH0039]
MPERTPKRPSQPRLHALHNSPELPPALQAELNGMKLLQPSANFTDRVMKDVAAGNTVPGFRPLAPKKRRHSELVNLFVATAATYIFINSGLLKLLNSHVAEWSEFVQHLSNRIG